MKIAVEERFWSKVLVGSQDECWPWQASLNGNGYGQFGCSRRKRPITAPRFALELLRGGDLPLGMYALHTCDNPRCVNPAHLYEGSLSDNTQDCIRRGRHRTGRGQSFNTGSRNGNAKLDEASVADIRSSGSSLAELASKYGVSEESIRLILRRKTWRHVA